MVDEYLNVALSNESCCDSCKRIGWSHAKYLINKLSVTSVMVHPLEGPDSFPLVFPVNDWVTPTKSKCLQETGPSVCPNSQNTDIIHYICVQPVHGSGFMFLPKMQIITLCSLLK